MDKKTMETVFSSKTGEWSTPQAFFDKLERVFDKFDLDAAATKENAKCDNFYTKEDDALAKDWKGKVFCNPPYGRGIGKWVKKGFDEGAKGASVVMLLPARVGTKWFCKYVMNAAEIYFVKGRLKFNDGKNSAPFPSMVVVFNDKMSNGLAVGIIERE
jgi:phage N-6-adenine-methyltransferase